MTETRDWSAHYNRMPGPDGPDPKLRVHGEAYAPNPGYTAELKPTSIGVNSPPGHVGLKLVLHEGSGSAEPEVMTWIPVDFAEDVGQDVTHVQIVTDEGFGPLIEVTVAD